MTNYEKLLDNVRKLGMDYKWANMFIKKLKDDERLFIVDDEEKKKWALERGFYPGRIELYGLTDENYKNFMPDYNYFMLHPMNNHFLKWLDKTTLKYVLNSNGCEVAMPEYYVYVENNGNFTYLMDCPNDINKDEDFLFNLLKKRGTLAMKPNSGTSGGLGFIKMEYRDGVLIENNKQIDMNRFLEIRDTMRNYIVTEYAYQHSELAEIWPNSECTLRVIMAKTPRENHFIDDEWFCVLALARFGTSISGGASNMSAGGIGVGFDYETGKYTGACVRERKYCPDGNWILESHPDTKVRWSENGLPNWPYTKKMIEKVCKHISSLEYLGLDIIITQDGMKICEINSHPGIDLDHLMCGEILAEEKTRNYFEKKGLYSFDAKEFYKAYVDSQE